MGLKSKKTFPLRERVKERGEFLKRFIVVLALLCVISPARAMMPITYDSTAMFTSGCLSCLKQAFDQVAGVNQINTGFVNAPHRIPVIRVLYDPRRVSYGRLVRTFWDEMLGPKGKGDFCYKNKHYIAGIFTTSTPQTEQAKRLLERDAEDRDAPLVVFIRPAPVFYFDSQRREAAEIAIPEAGCR